MGDAKRRKALGLYPAETAKGERVCSACGIPTPPHIALPDGKHRPGVCDQARKAVADEMAARAMDTTVR